MKQCAAYDTKQDNDIAMRVESNLAYGTNNVFGMEDCPAYSTNQYYEVVT